MATAIVRRNKVHLAARLRGSPGFEAPIADEYAGLNSVSEFLVAGLSVKSRYVALSSTRCLLHVKLERG